MCKSDTKRKITLIFQKTAVLAVTAAVAAAVVLPYFLHKENKDDDCSDNSSVLVTTDSPVPSDTPVSTVTPSPTESPLLEGLQEIDGALYFYREDEICYGWITDGDLTYYFDDDGKAVCGWQTIEDTEYFFGKDCALANGIVSTDRGLRCFVDGHVVSGLKSDDSGTYFFGEDGTAQVGWQNVDGKRLYFLKTGCIANGFVQIGSNKYYFKDGEFVLGWQTIGSKKYYFYDNGKMAVNTELDGYEIGSDGVALKSGCTPENLNNYLDDLLRRYGRSPGNIYDAVHDNMTYKWAPEGNSCEEMACYAINNGKGACYHYAALGYCLFKRAGYEVIIISGINGRTGNDHKWLYVKTDTGWIYVDPVYSNGRNMTEQFLLDLGCKWDRSALPTD